MDYSIKTLQELAIFYRDIDFLARYTSNSIPSLSLIPNFKYLNDNIILKEDIMYTTLITKKFLD